MPTRTMIPSQVVPGAVEALNAAKSAVLASGVPRSTFVLVHLRVSQLNGRAIAIPQGTAAFRDAWKEDRRLERLAGWRESEDFTEAERAALALAEAETHLHAAGAAVSDEVWHEVTRHYDEKQLGALVLQIGLVNLWNRANVVTEQRPVDWGHPEQEWVRVTTRAALA